MQEFIIEHFYAVIGFVSFVLIALGYNMREYASKLDKNRKLEEVLIATHVFLSTIKDKTPTPIDDAIDLGVQFAIKLLENKHNIVEFSEEEKKELYEALKKEVVKALNGK